MPLLEKMEKADEDPSDVRECHMKKESTSLTNISGLPNVVSDQGTHGLGKILYFLSAGSLSICARGSHGLPRGVMGFSS